jgi:D-sedoheptulose 7-phosphate isomerase
MGIDAIKALFLESVEVKKKVLEEGCCDILAEMGEVITQSVMNGGKILLCGNGGSAADAQHLAAEMLVRLRPMNNREGIPALALAQDTSTITGCGNDFGYDQLFARMVSAIGHKGDVLLGITTSGNSKNVNLAFEAASAMGLHTFAFLGSGGGDSLELCEKAFLVPSNNTGRIQESHITAGHALMEYVEDRLIEEKYLHLEDVN